MLTPYQTPPWRLDNWKTLAADERRAYQGRVLSQFIREQVLPYSTFYRQVFKEQGITADDIRSIDDLTKIPLTSKTDLLSSKDYPDRPWDFVLLPAELREQLEVPSNERAEWFHSLTTEKQNTLDRFLWEYFPTHANHTTGRSAPPTPVWFTRRDLYDHAEKIRRCVSFTRHDPMGNMLVLWPFTAISHQAFWCMPIYGLAVGAQIIHSGGGKAAGTEALLQLAKVHRPQSLCIMPGYAFHFIRRAKEAGVEFENLRTVLIGGEKCTNEMRQKLHEGFVSLGADARQLHIVVSYGATEFRGGAQECLTPPDNFSSSGYHTFPDMEIFEIVDPDTGEPVPEGTTGEVVYTCLDGRGTVLLRYRTGDIAVGGMTTQPCPYCGSTVPRISNELQRSSNMHDLQLTKLKGSLIDIGSFVPLLRGIDSVEEFQVELCKKNDDTFGVDELIVHVAAKAGTKESEVVETIKSTVRAAIEVEPNRVIFHSLPKMLEMVGMESALKDIRLVDNRPQESRI